MAAVGCHFVLLQICGFLMPTFLIFADALLAEWLWLPDVGIFASICCAIICLPVVVCMAAEAAFRVVSC